MEIGTILVNRWGYEQTNIGLGNWDFNYCPFCGKEIKEND